VTNLSTLALLLLRRLGAEALDTRVQSVATAGLAGSLLVPPVVHAESVHLFFHTMFTSALAATVRLSRTPIRRFYSKSMLVS